MSQNKPKSLKGANKAMGYVVTANHLLSGDAIYLSLTHEWAFIVGEALIFKTQEAADQMAVSVTKAQAHVIAGAYVIALAETALPVSNRERIRAVGPTNYFHGKQQIVTQPAFAKQVA